MRFGVRNEEDGMHMEPMLTAFFVAIVVASDEQLLRSLAPEVVARELLLIAHVQLLLNMKQKLLCLHDIDRFSV